MSTGSYRLGTRRTKWCAFLKSDDGQALVTTALALPVLLGFAGLAIDMGVLRYDKRLQQTAADAAAVAGANEIPSGSLDSIKLAAQSASAANNFTKTSDSLGDCGPGAPIGTVCVQVKSPPLSGPHATGANATNYVEVLVAAVQPTYFMKAFGVTQSTVTARAVATLVSQQSNTKPGCVYALAPPGTKAGSIGITVQGGTTVNATSCGFSDNGDFTASNNTSLIAGSVGVAGTPKAGATCSSLTGNCPAPQTPTPDPMSYLTPPASCTNLGSVHINNSQVVSFAPGTYCANDFIVNGGATVCNSVHPPWYPSTKGKCNGMPGNANSGVTFYVTGTVSINGGSQVQLSAPNSGPYAGILFYQDPTDSATATLNGNSVSYYQGALYFPGAELDFGGGTNATMFNQGAAYTTIVASDVKFAGGPIVYINSDYSQLPNGASIISNAVLVE